MACGGGSLRRSKTGMEKQVEWGEAGLKEQRESSSMHCAALERLGVLVSMRGRLAGDGGHVARVVCGAAQWLTTAGNGQGGQRRVPRRAEANGREK